MAINLGDLAVTIASAVTVLSIVVVVHELGHFWAARACGVAVDAFSLGWGKSLVEWQDKAGVRWKIARWPIGGFVKFRGDENAASFNIAGYTDPEERAEGRKAGVLQAMPLWVRAFVSAAGPLANFVFAVLVFAALFWAVGRPEPPERAEPVIAVVQEGSAAEQAGLVAGDRIRAVDARRVSSFADLQGLIAESGGRNLRLEVQRGDDVLVLDVTPELRRIEAAPGEPQEIGVLGILRDGVERLSPIGALGAGIEQTWSILSGTVVYLGKLLTGAASSEHLAGPLGIADMSGQVAKEALSVSGLDFGRQALLLTAALAQLAAALSVAIGFANLLPIPLLDGGHLVFYAAEAIRGRPLGPRAQAIGFNIGLFAVACLFLFATWNDIRRIF